MRDSRVVLGLAGIGILARVPGLGGDLWIDEIASLVGFMRLPFAELLTTYGSANNHVFYSVLAHASMGLFGETAWAVRLPAMLFGAATVPALFLLARSALPRPEALGAALILAFLYHHAYFSQNARGYTGMVFLAVVTTNLLRRALERDDRQRWIGWAVASALSVYMLLSGLFVCVGQVMGVLILRRDRFKPLALWTSVAALLTVVLYAPLMPSMFQFYANADTNAGWSPADVVWVILRDATPYTPVAVAGLVALPVAVVGAVSVARRLPLVFFGLLLPPLLELGVALGIGAGTYPRRFLLIVPFAVLVSVRGCAIVADWVASRWKPARYAFPAMITTLALAGAMGLPRLYTLPKQDYRGALAIVAERKQEGDLVVAAYTATTGTQYYDASVLPARSAGDLRRLLDRNRPIWLVGTFVSDMQTRVPDLAALIEEEFQFVARRIGLVGDGDVVVWTLRK